MSRLIDADKVCEILDDIDGFTFFAPESVKQLLEEVPTVEPNPGWISVKDRLPDRLDEYLVVNCGKVGLAIYHDGLWFAPTRNVEITHWMPLPEPPKMEGGETDE